MADTAIKSDQQPRTAADIMAALAKPFDPEEIKSKPAVVSGNRALAMFYVDARVVQDRLDEVLGVVGWQDDYQLQADGGVVCKLRCKIEGEWIQKVDVGSPSEQPDGGDRMKAAFSDALKRAAVKFGIGRFLYRLPTQWCDYDPQKRQFVRPPVLPASLYAPTITARGDIVPPASQVEPEPTPVTTKPAPPPAKRNGDVSAQECQELNRLLRDTKSAPTDFLAWVTKAVGKEVAFVERMPAAFYDQAVAMLEKKQKEQQKTKQKAGAK